MTILTTIKHNAKLCLLLTFFLRSENFIGKVDDIKKIDKRITNYHSVFIMTVVKI